MQTRRSLLFCTAGLLGACIGCRKQTAVEDHTAWVGQILTNMLRVRPGMTRNDLVQVFTEEGGISTRWQRTYVSRECPYFKVNVTFHPAPTPTRKSLEHLGAAEDERDVIASISEPYLGFAAID